jgi:hypothetical protein
LERFNLESYNDSNLRHRIASIRLLPFFVLSLVVLYNTFPAFPPLCFFFSRFFFRFSPFSGKTLIPQESMTQILVGATQRSLIAPSAISLVVLYFKNSAFS